jgi:hypothetical protein
MEIEECEYICQFSEILVIDQHTKYAPIGLHGLVCLFENNKNRRPDIVDGIDSKEGVSGYLTPHDKSSLHFLFV